MKQCTALIMLNKAHFSLWVAQEQTITRKKKGFLCANKYIMKTKELLDLKERSWQKKNMHNSMMDKNVG